MLKELTPLANKIIITRSTHKQASSNVAGEQPIGLKRALRLTTGQDRVIAGSLFLAADALKLLLSVKKKLDIKV